jgi:hypothetical protein
MMPVDCKLHDETSANCEYTTFFLSHGAMFSSLPFRLVYKFPIKKQGGARNFKGPSQEGGRVKLAENLRASPLNNELSNETTFSLIHLAGQYL